MDGWHCRYLRIDPRPGQTACVASGDRWYRDFLGGVGLGTWIVAHEMSAGTDPLEPEAALADACSPLVGSPLTTSATFAVVALSPLTGRVCEALASSHFAIAAKRAGIDAPAITGEC
jgi:aldehyde:ferredoxin oxidoreductase